MIARSAAFLLAALIAACAAPPQAPAPHVPQERVILLPSSDGAPSAVIVKRGEREVVLDTPYARASAGRDEALEVGQADAQATKQAFAGALQALPPAPTSFVVYFVFGQDELTEESRKALAPVLDEVARRPAPEVTVVGHADQTGAEHVNVALSLSRAERVRQLLVQRGIPAESVLVAGRGSREPLVRAPEGVAEPRNRRVEITVR